MGTSSGRLDRRASEISYATPRAAVEQRARVTATLALVALAIWPAVASAHGTEAGHVVTVPFAVAVALSTLLSVGIGVAIVRRYRSKLAVDPGHGSTTHVWMAALLLLLGLLALLSAAERSPAVAIGGVTFGGAAAWFGRDRGVSPHAGCADAAFGAVFVHRTVEGVLVAGLYVASAALGVLGLAFLTLHAIGETAAIGGLYAPLGRGWGIAAVVGINVGFLVGALIGGYAGALSPTVVTGLLAGIAGVLLVTGATERRVSAGRDRLEGSAQWPE